MKIFALVFVAAHFFPTAMLATDKTDKSEKPAKSKWVENQCDSLSRSYRLIPYVGAAKARFEPGISADDDRFAIIIDEVCFRKHIPGYGPEVVFRLKESPSNVVQGRSNRYAIHAVTVALSKQLTNDEIVFIENDGGEKIDSLLFPLDNVSFNDTEFGYDGSYPQVMIVDDWSSLFIVKERDARRLDDFQNGIMGIAKAMTDSSPRSLF